MVCVLDSSVIWDIVSMCEIESNYILIKFSMLYHKFVCHVEHYSYSSTLTVTPTLRHDKGIAKCNLLEQQKAKYKNKTKLLKQE